ncbi:6-Pyruvoyl-Tetrahydropterin Synthase [Agrobacterium tumefaciens]|nr:6-Pyruvoyl-Tetrahydropterin Synthase [Agrobacterium tumefaciens]
MQDLAEEQPGALVLGIVEEFGGRILFDDLALVHEDDAVCDLAGKAHFVGDAQHRHAVFGEADHGVEHFLDHFRVKRRGRLIEQHDLRLHAERAGDRHTLLLTARKLARILMCLLGNLHALQIVHRHFFGFLFRHLANPDWRQRAVLKDRQMREEVEVLEHHADFATDFVDLLEVVGEFDAVNDDAARLVLFQTVDAADHGRLARAGRTGDDNALALHDLQVDITQHVEIAVPFVHAGDFDCDVRRRDGQFFCLGFCHFERPLSFMPGVEVPFHEQRITRHAEAEDPEYEACEDIARHGGNGGRPVRIRLVECDDTEQVEHADDRDQRRVLEQPDEGVDDARNDELQRLWQYDQPRLLPVVQAERIRSFILSLRNGLQAAADHFRHIGGGEQRHADQRAQELVEGPAVGQEQRQHDAGEEQHRDQRDASDDLDEEDAEHLDDRQVRTSAKRQKNAEGQRHRDPEEGQDERDHQAAPELRFHLRQAEDAADKQEKRNEGQDDEERQRIETLERRLRNEHRDQQDGEHHHDEDRTPAFIDGVAAKDELAELGRNESPAGAGLSIRQRAAL